MTESISTDLSSQRYDADELGQYRSLSSLAVVSVVLGLCSVLMFASPVMVVVPLAAAATALLALRGIAVSDGGLTGSRLALAGLAFAIMFAVGSYARVMVRDSIVQRQVDQIGREWLDLASGGQVEGMLGLMTKAAAEKLKPQLEVAQPGSFFSGMLTSALMRQDPVVVELSKMSAAGGPKYQVRGASILATAQPAQALLEYKVTGSGSDELSCAIGFKRYQAAGNQQAWLIDSWALEP